MEWVKVLHLFGVIGWMAGVFYMPRLLVNIVEAHKAGEPIGRLLGMAAGIWVWLGYGMGGRWLHWKLVFVLGLVVYYSLSAVWLAQMRRGDFRHSSIFYRVYNEFSLLMFVPILIFAVTKIG